MRSSQNLALTLDTWAPKSIKAMVSHPFTSYWGLIGAPYQTHYWIRVEKWNRGNFQSSSFLSCLHLGQFGFRVREGMMWIYCWLLLVGGFATSPWFPPSLFNILAGVAHSLAIWPQPWHLKHWSELESFAFSILPWPSLGLWVFPLPWGTVPTLLEAEELQAEVVWPRPVWPL